MSLFFSRHLRLFSAFAAAIWLVVFLFSAYRLATGSFALDFDGASYYSASAVLGVGILCTTVVLVGVQARVSQLTGDPVRGAGLLGLVAAVLAAAFVWFIPGWLGLFLFAVAGTVLRSRNTGLTSPLLRVIVLSGVGLCALSVIVSAFLTMSGAAVGAAMWVSLVVLGGVLIAWHAALAIRADSTADSAPRPPAAS